jgi:hypothetical protein
MAVAAARTQASNAGTDDGCSQLLLSESDIGLGVTDAKID